MELLAPAVREDNLPDLELIDLSVEHRLLRLGVSALLPPAVPGDRGC